MKKNFVYAMMSAIALSGAVSLTSCSSNEEVAEVNPTYDGESVKTQFTISFPSNVANTRMAANEVQAGQTIADFRGMDNIKLIPFGVNATITATDTRIGAPIVLAQQIIGSAVADKTVSNYIEAADLTNNSNSVLYQDVQIPVGTGAFLFYGKAIDNVKNTAITTIADKFKFGTLTPSAALSTSKTGVPTDITFTPVGIKETVSSEGTGTAEKIVEYMNAIAGATGWAAETNPAIAQLYTRFISMRAGSSQAVADLLGDLLWAIRNNTSDVADNIRKAIYHDHTPNASGEIACTDGYIAKAVEATGTYEVTLGSSCDGYPANQNLPEGAAQISWNGTTSEFEVISTNVPTATSSSMNVASLDKYVYPANLQYYVNSRAMVSETSQKDKYNGSNTWAQIISNYTPGYVSTPTRSVAIELPIQYGVGQLKMRARTAVAALEDNSDKVETAPETKVTVPDGGFPIKGILIGGQRAVDWEFLPKTGTDLYTIYDVIKSTTSSNISVAKSTFAEAYNYTLALETPIQEHVYIALEIENNSGQAFYGQGNQIVLPGRTFYLVGELDPTTNTTQKYVRNHNTYWSNGNPAQKTTSDNIDQVFVQDYVTTINITIQNLRKALNTIPDLRMPNMEFGLSVDLTWNPGITFNVDFQ
jgi:hypothetical protein